MKNLLLLRHAKSSWSNPGLIDFDRGLNDRGEVAASKMARFLADHMPLPDKIACSSAKRTRETLKALLSHYAHEMEIRLERALYMPIPTAMMGIIQQTDDDVETLMIISHNPGMEELALSLSKPCHSDAMNDMLYKYPTGACAHLTFDVASWVDVRIKCGDLVSFTKPRDLD